jgi:hypothetical protein
MIHKEKEVGRLWVNGLGEELYDCYKKGILPSEEGYRWSCAGRTVNLRDYHYYPGGILTADRADKAEG